MIIIFSLLIYTTYTYKEIRGEEDEDDEGGEEEAEREKDKMRARR
jgi:hypothetical protein